VFVFCLVIESNFLRWPVNVACTGETIIMYGILMRKPLIIATFVTSKIWDGNIKMNLREIYSPVMTYIRSEYESWPISILPNSGVETLCFMTYYKR
jgi:hypothetical protein